MTLSLEESGQVYRVAETISKTSQILCVFMAESHDVTFMIYFVSFFVFGFLYL